MRFMILIKATQKTESEAPPTAELRAAMGKFNDELQRAGVLIDAHGLYASAHGARVRFSGGTRMVSDGPFAEIRELIAGYWIWELPSLQEALRWVKRCPNPTEELGEIEVREIMTSCAGERPAAASNAQLAASQHA